MAIPCAPLLLLLFLLAVAVGAFESDELLPTHDDDEFEGTVASSLPQRTPASPKPAARRRVEAEIESNSVQFTLEHSLGQDGSFSPAGTFSARLKSSPHGSQTLTKLRFSRNALTESEKEEFERLLKDDGLYTIQLPSNVQNPSGKSFVTSSIRARCIPHESLDEHITIHMDGINILAVNYGSIGGCPYPRPLKIPKQWTFNSYTILKTAEQAPRTPTFAEQLVEAEAGLGEVAKPPEKSFWAKYWMYMIPLGLVVMNVLSAAANAPAEEQGAGQAQQAGAQRAPSAAARRR